MWSKSLIGQRIDFDKYSMTDATDTAQRIAAK